MEELEAMIRQGIAYNDALRKENGKEPIGECDVIFDRIIVTKKGNPQEWVVAMAKYAVVTFEDFSKPH